MNLLQNVYDLSSRITGCDSAGTSIAEALHNAMTSFECHECRNSNIMTEAQLEEAAEESFAGGFFVTTVPVAVVKLEELWFGILGFTVRKQASASCFFPYSTHRYLHTHTTVNSRAKTCKCFRKAFQNLQHPSVRS